MCQFHAQMIVLFARRVQRVQAPDQRRHSQVAPLVAAGIGEPELVLPGAQRNQHEPRLFHRAGAGRACSAGAAAAIHASICAIPAMHNSTVRGCRNARPHTQSAEYTE